MKKKPVFIHIPKTGGQSIHKAMGIKNGPHRPVRRVRRTGKKYIFSVVRNPFDRAVSLFHWYSQLHLTPEKRRTPHNAAMNMLARGCGVNEFWLEFVSREGLDYQGEYTQMMKSQKFFLSDKMGSIHGGVDKVLRFENLEQDFEEVRGLFGFDELPHENSSRRLSWQEVLYPVTMEKIAELYREDFTEFYPEFL